MHTPLPSTEPRPHRRAPCGFVLSFLTFIHPSYQLYADAGSTAVAGPVPLTPAAREQPKAVSSEQISGQGELCSDWLRSS